MAQKKVFDLTNLQNVKRIDPQLNLGTSANLLEVINILKQLRGFVDGVRGLVGRQKIILPLAGSTHGKELITFEGPRSKAKEANYEEDELLFPSDFVSWLSGLAEILRGANIGQEKSHTRKALRGHFIAPTRNEYLKKWGDFSENWVAETTIFGKHYHEVQEFIDILIEVCQDHLERGLPKPPSGYLLFKQFSQELEPRLVENIVRSTPHYDRISNREDIKKQFSEEVLKILRDNLWIERSLFDNPRALTGFNQQEWLNKDLVRQESAEDFVVYYFSNTIFYEEEFKNWQKNLIDRFHEENKDLHQKYIPQKQPGRDEVVGAEPEADGERGGDEDQQADQNLIIENELIRLVEDDLSLDNLRLIILQNIPGAQDLENNKAIPQINNYLERLEATIDLELRNADFVKEVILDIQTPITQGRLKKDGLIQDTGSSETTNQTGSTDGQALYRQAILQSNWYVGIKNDLIDNFLSNHRPTLHKNFIEPALEFLSREAQQPPPLPQLAQQFPDLYQAPETAADPGSINTETKRRIQYEAVWIANTAIFELLDSQGWDPTNLSSELQEKVAILRSEIYNQSLVLLASYSQHELNQLFASASHRQRAVAKLIAKLGEVESFRNNFAQLASQAPATLRDFGPDEEGASQKLQSSPLAADEVFEQKLSKVLDGQLESVDLQNIDQILTSLGLQYGVNGLTIAQEGEVAEKAGKDAVWFINQLSDEQLVIIFFPNLFGLTTTDKGIVKQVVKIVGDPSNRVGHKLRSLLTARLKVKFAELILHTKDTRIAQGLGEVSREDQKALKNKADFDGFRNHFQFSAHPLKDKQELVKRVGDDKVVAGALFYTSNKHWFKSLQKMYDQSWQALRRNEQEFIYKIFDIPIHPQFANSLSLPFVPEFVWLSAKDLDLIKSDAKSFEENFRQGNSGAEASEFVENSIAEASLGEFLKANYLNQLTDSRKEILDQHLPESVDDSSFFGIQATDNRLEREQENSLWGRLKNRFNNLRGRSSKNRLKTTLNRVAASKSLKLGKVGKLLGKASVVTGILTALADKKNRKRLGYASALLGFALAKAIHNMTQTLGGLVGGVGGGVAGGWLGFKAGGLIGGMIGGPIGAGIGSAVGAIAGTIVGAWGGSEFGRWLGPELTFGSEASGARNLLSGGAGEIGAMGAISGDKTIAPQAEVGGGGGLLGDAAGAISNVSFGTIVASSTVGLVAIITLQTLTTIHNAFLAPLPAGVSRSLPAADTCREATITPNDCFFQTNYIWHGSYDPAGETYTDSSNFGGGSGHGSNQYWNAVGGFMNVCGYNLPTSGFAGGPIAPSAAAGGENNVCYRRNLTPTGSHYGYALDVAPFASAAEGRGDSCLTLYLPLIDNVERWDVGREIAFGNGNAVIITGNDAHGVPTYKVLIGHVDGVYPGANRNPGERFAQLYNWLEGNIDNAHAHIEVIEIQGGDEVVRRPEDVFCRNI